MKNRLILAAAGSGKTQYIINEAIKITDAKVLITTYTISNTDEIKKKTHSHLRRLNTWQHSCSDMVLLFTAAWYKAILAITF